MMTEAVVVTSVSTWGSIPEKLKSVTAADSKDQISDHYTDNISQKIHYLADDLESEAANSTIGFIRSVS